MKFLLQRNISAIRGRSLLVRMDNVCAMYYVNRLGGRSPGLSHIAEQIWKICSHHAVNLQASYLPGAENHLADGLSRASLDRQDYKLNPAIFRLVQLRFGRFSVDLFASRQNRQLRRYASWRPDPRALWVDAMRHSWIKESAYGNPPFTLALPIVSKVQREGSTVTLVLPLWASQPW